MMNEQSYEAGQEKGLSGQEVYDRATWRRIGWICSLIGV